MIELCTLCDKDAEIVITCMAVDYPACQGCRDAICRLVIDGIEKIRN